MGLQPRGRQSVQGFTLIEIIVVVLIIGIIVSFATLSISDRSQDDRLEVEVQRLTQLLQLASDEAVLLGIELGMGSAKGVAYAFMVIGEEGQWQIYETDGPLRPRQLPDGVKMEIAVEEFSAPIAEQDEEEPLLPSLLFLSSGELTPFELQLTAEGARNVWRIEGDLTGKIQSRLLTEEDLR